MAESDRERLERLAQQKETQRQEEAARKRKEDEAQRQQFAVHEEANRQKTAELLAWCKETFSGFKLKATGHELNVETVQVSHAPPKMTHLAVEFPYVSLYIRHPGRETGFFPGSIPVFQIRWAGRYIAFGPNWTNCEYATFEEVKTKLMESVADVNRDDINMLFDRQRHKKP